MKRHAHAETCPPCARMRAGEAPGSPRPTLPSPGIPEDWRRPVPSQAAALATAHARRRSLGGRLTWALMGLLMRKER